VNRERTSNGVGAVASKLGVVAGRYRRGLARDGQRTAARTTTFGLLAAAGLLGIGCTGFDHTHADHHGGEEKHGHAHDEEEHGHPHGGISITRWSDGLELFAEHEPAIVGRKLELTTHLTTLGDFAPLKGASITFELKGPEQLRVESKTMIRDGIYQPALTPREAGTYEGKLQVRAEGLEETISGFQVVVHPDAAAAEAAQKGEEHEEHDEGISFLKEQQWRVPFGTTFVTTRELVPTIEVGATVTTPPGGFAELGAPVAGRLVAPKGGLARPGAMVKAGQLLATVAPTPSSPEGAARASLAVAEAEARAASATSGAQRAERLFDEKAVAERQLEEARREAEVANEALRAARRASQLFAGSVSGKGSGTWKIVAPIDGVLDSVQANPGSAVSAGQHLFTLLDPSELWIVARVPEVEAARLRTEEDAYYRLTRDSSWQALSVKGDAPTAELISTSRVVNSRSRTVEVTYLLHKEDAALRVGALVRVAVPSGEPTRGLALPREAIVEEGGRSLVYVQTEGESFEERDVRLGARSGGWVAIIDGVSEGERVVSKGANVIRLSSRASAGVGHGHVH